jgi:arylsulfatase A-like enzyme
VGLHWTALGVPALIVALLVHRRAWIVWFVALLPTVLVYVDHLARTRSVPGLAYDRPGLFLAETLAAGTALAAAGAGLLGRARWRWHFPGGRASAVGAVLLGPVLLVFALGGSPAPPPRVGSAPPEAANVLLLTVDTLRQDALGVYGGPATPGFDAWIAQGVRADGWAPSGWTRTSMGSLFSGLVPTGHGGEADAPVRGDVPWWPEDLARAGWRTRAWITNPQLYARFGFYRGFGAVDHAEILEVLDPVAATVWARWIHRLRAEGADRADRVLDGAIDWLRGRPEGPWLVWVHLIDPHLPYYLRGPRGEVEDPDPAAVFEPLQPYLERGALRDVELLRGAGFADDPAAVAALQALYRREVGFVDRRVGALLEAAQTASTRRPLLWILTSDHGEEFAEHGGFEHGHSLHDELLRVPLALGGLDLPVGRAVGAMGLIDVGPTVLSLLGRPVPQLEETAQLPGRPSALIRRVVGRDRSGALRRPAEGVGDCDPPALLAESTLYGPPLTRWIGEGVLRDDATLGLFRLRPCSSDAPAPLSAAGLDPLPRDLFDALDGWRLDRPRLHRPELVDDDALRARLRSLGYIH